MAKSSPAAQPVASAMPESPAYAARVGRMARPRRSYGRIEDQMAPPALITVQLESYDWFKRDALVELFREISPIVSFNKNLELHFLGHRFDEPKFGVAECRVRGPDCKAAVAECRVPSAECPAPSALCSD